MMYNIIRIKGQDDQDLIVHMCQSNGKNMVEIIGDGPVVLTQEQFNELTGWVEQQFENLSKVIHLVH